MSSLVYAFRYLRRLVREYSDLFPFVLFVLVDPLPPNQQFKSCLDEFLSSTNTIS